MPGRRLTYAGRLDRPREYRAQNQIDGTLRRPGMTLGALQPKPAFRTYNGLMKIALSLYLGLVAQTLLAADTIPSARAKEHIGQDGTVCGKVADTRYLESGKRPTFLNFDERYPKHTFTAVIFGENRAKFGAPEKEYLEKDICVTGKIEDYNGKPEIIITEPQQIKVASK
jgi:hypothetical protein